MRRLMARGELWVVVQGVLFLIVAGTLWWGGAVEVSAGWLVSGVLLTLVGAALAADGVFRIRHNITALPDPVAGAPLVEDGSYRLARHPIYGGLALVTLGLALARGSAAGLTASVVLGGFFWLKARHEERLLDSAYPEYAGYKSRVKRRLIPWIV